MALPEGGKTAWPPESARPALRLTREWAAWWSGDPVQLINQYGAGVGGGQVIVPTTKSVFKRFWERIAGGVSKSGPERQRAYLHVPLASDIAATSAALLFSEAPLIQVPEAHGERPSSDAKTAEAEIQAMREEGDFDSRLLEGGDFAAGLGGVYLKPTWDLDLADVPLLSVVQPDQAIPEFRHGILIAVTLWREIERTDRDVIRHLERHEVDADGRGVVLHALYRGKDDELGDPMSPAELTLRTRLDPVVDLPFDGLGIHYVPNTRPNRRLRGSPLGQSDYAGAEGFLDALDETWASWMRDIRLGKARLLVAREMLNTDGQFDPDHEVYSPLDVPVANAAVKDQILAQQFDIRFEAHEKTSLALIDRIVDHAGYAPQTFGLKIEGRAESGTALNIRERKTFLTQQRKAAWWGAAIATVVEQMQWIRRDVFGSTTPVFRPRVALSDSIAPDMRQTAETVEFLERARAASIEVKVKLLHPDWEAEEVNREVARIQAEQGLAVTPPEVPAA